MERLQELIAQLREQFERKAEPSQMLQTTRLLDAELQRLAGQQATAGRVSAKVAVMMPSSMKMYTGQSPLPAPEPHNVESRNGSAEFKKDPAEVRSSSPIASPIPAAVAAPATVTSPSAVAAPSAIAASTAVAAAAIAPVPVLDKAPERGAWPFDPLADKPADRYSLPGKPIEVNDLIGSYSNGSSSLNEKLKSNVLELKSALNDTPVRDLKKAIGVNDRYVFINQLFRGDEVMYERSLKTINGFRILPEAEYWMERELKVKLGWDENREATRQFYQLVKRRFS
jgi:hypothetical protein